MPAETAGSKKGALRLRKALSSILVLILLLGMVLPASAADPVQIKVSYPTGTAVGGTFTVTVSCSGNTGLSGAQMILNYNGDVLDCTSCKTGPVLSGMTAVTNSDLDNEAIIGAVSTSVSEKDGTICTFEFKVLGSGNYDFELSDFCLLALEGGTLLVNVSGMDYSESEDSKPNSDKKPEGEKKPESTIDTSFTDTKGHWAAAEIEKAVETGLVEGYGDGIYGPNDQMTRGQFVTILWRYAGSPEPKGQASFTDLEPQHTYYHKAVAWAEENGVVNGMGGGKFEPRGSVTREQIATTLFRMQGEKSGEEVMFSGIYDSAFTDSANISDWAKAAVYWAVYQEIWCAVDSTDSGTALNSRSPSNRAQIAVMMTRYQEKFTEGE